jgi:outer membrane protein OmpA-like peptidoglycan-associated protein
VSMYEYDDEEGGGRSIGRLAAVAAGIVAVAAIGWFGVRPRLGGDEGGATEPTGAVASTDSGPSSTSSTTSTTEPRDDTSTTAAAKKEAATTVAPTTTEAVAPTTTTQPAAPPATDPPPPPPTQGPATYPTLPDGTPVPINAIFDVNQITLVGYVPDQAAKDRLQALAIANSKPGQADSVANFLVVDPNVPRGIGVRVVELTSTRFPEGSAEILPPHAVELDRAVAIMNALPNLTALVIGHSDQRGDELVNFALSEQRADAVVAYLVGHGVAPSRLSSRAVGEEDLLTLNNDEAALALNRRTEFVFYGLLQ